MVASLERGEATTSGIEVMRLVSLTWGDIASIAGLVFSIAIWLVQKLKEKNACANKRPRNR